MRIEASIIFEGINEIKICACGNFISCRTYIFIFFERLSKIKCNVEIASEFRYKEPLLTKDTFCLSLKVEKQQIH